MSELLTAAQMRAIEQAAIESGEVTGLELMERAGQGVVEAIFEEWPELAKVGRGASPSGSPGYLGQENETGLRAVVFCGPGNNGGDGFVVARLLVERGWAVEVVFRGRVEKLPPDAMVNYHLLDPAIINPTSDRQISKADLYIDALFGTGLTRKIDDPAIWEDLWLVDDVLDVQSSYRDRSALGHPYSVAIDMPTGIHTDTGMALGEIPEHGLRSARVNLTVTFHKAKCGHYIGDGPEFCGNIVVKDIGLHPDRMRLQAGEALQAVPTLANLTKQDFPELQKHSDNHKFSYGHALILSGPSGKGGAARLSAHGALRIGAGLVTVAPTPSALQENAARLDAVMLAPVGDAQTLQAVLADERLNALCLGPGLGVERARDLVPVTLAAKRATVLDADALMAFKDDPSVLFDMLHVFCVLTPHAGEFARLFPDIAEKLNASATIGPAFSKVDAAREAAARAGCVVLFKGPGTVIAAPDGTCAINSAAYDRAAPWLATAGSGDVLAGFITGLLARGFAPLQAAETAAWLHVECALEFGPGLIAEDLPEMLPAVFRKLGL